MNAPTIKQLDVRGQICPSTLLLALREVNRLHEELKRGEAAIEVLTDNRNATITIPNAVKHLGMIARISQREDCYQILIERAPT